MSPPHHLILTTDYELFGNGSGSVHDCACAPLARMAHLVEGYGGSLEIFVDAVEFAVMESEPDSAETIVKVRRQLADMVRRGHRIQMHIHPQWDGARLSGGQWALNFDSWRTGDIEREQLYPLMESALAWIRDVVQEVSPGYTPSVFRAGGWCIQPSRNVVPILRAMGLKADSSVAPGLVNHDPAAWYDFRNCPASSWWPVDSEVDRAGRGDLVEIPIATGRVNPVSHLRARVSRRRGGEFAPGCRGTYRGRSAGMSRLADVWWRLQGIHRAMLDYCALPANLMIEVAQGWLERFNHVDATIPVVAIGHTKNFSHTAEEELEKMLHWVSGQEFLRFGNYRSWYEEAMGRGQSVNE